MASLKELTKEQKYAIYIFMEEYDKSIYGNHTINPVGFYMQYGVGYDEIKEFRDNIKEEDRFSYAIRILKEIKSERLFRTLMNECYSMLKDMIQFTGIERFTKDYSKLLDLFKIEFGYDCPPISEILP